MRVPVDILHGHNWVVELGVRRMYQTKINSKAATGMIIDFKALDSVFRPIINHHWDHNLLLNKYDDLLIKATLAFL